ncbi:MAG TPA: PIG-L family deacetylase [Candidatus Hydrogenedentes bacterium]|nr:PIG-L family deacetylase [Candidatus Hydrogenedentota bacterium]
MNVVCIGAHPDDAEFHAGGSAVKWAQLGHRVVFVSLTNGDIGHHAMGGGVLAQRRRAEALRSARIGGVEDVVLDHHDGELDPSLELRREVVRLIRRYEADLVLTHRPFDYHPDHRYTGIVVQDAAFMVTVPQFCPDVPALRENPIFLYVFDPFQKPVPFSPDIAVDVTDVMDVKYAMFDAMTSQAYEWLPWLAGTLDTVPEDEAGRRCWLEQAWAPRFLGATDACRAGLERWYGAAASEIRYAEAFEICEYGRRPSEEEIRELFPFLPR